MKAKTMAKIGAGLALLGGLYLGANHLADNHIKYSVLNVHVMPEGLVSCLPGKTDQSIDLFLNNIEEIWKNSSSNSEKAFVLGRVLSFTEEHKPKRMFEVYEKVLNFLDETGYYNLRNSYAWEYMKSTDDSVFIKKYSK